MDQASFSTTVMVWGAITNQPVNYAKFIWEDMVSRQKQTPRKANVAYPRFFSAIIADHLGSLYPAPTKGHSHPTIGVKALEHDSSNISVQLRDVLVTGPVAAAAVPEAQPLKQ